MQALFFLYSLSYFFLLRKHPLHHVYAGYGFVFLFINVLTILAGIFGFITSGSVKCHHSVTYSSVGMILSAVGIVCSLLVVVFTGINFMRFKQTGTIPFFDSAGVKKKNAVADDATSQRVINDPVTVEHSQSPLVPGQ